MTPEEILQKYWHYSSFRPLQKEIIDSVMGGNDTLALLPTGGGKSLCYQIPALSSEGIALVISPLIALMKDQVSQLKHRHIAAACITSGMRQNEINSILNNSVFGKLKLLYVSPERLQNRTFIDHFRQMPISLIAVDEAHCISQWGYDFRPPYLDIARIRQYHPSAPVIALTATATPIVVRDIQNKLEFRKGNLFQGSFVRPNLSYCVVKTEDKQGLILRIARNVGGCGIIYVRNRRHTVEYARMLNDQGLPAAAYHAGLPMKERDQKQKEWLASKFGIMVATTAFGMGIDKPDVRYVIHTDLPESPEEYFQEAGRAGRDGMKAYAVLAYNDGDIDRLRQGLERSFPPISYIKNVYRAVCNYYQIPVGSGLDSHFDFELDKICDTYNFDYVSFFCAAKFLEREGLFSLPEHNELTSKLKITIDKEELYRFLLSNDKANDVVPTIIRTYGGLFTDYTPISESLIAKRCNMSETNVCNLLKELDRLKIAEYQPKTLKPQIIFCSERIDIKDIHISDQNYKQLKNAAADRREAMISYTTSSSECRSKVLLRYFGETDSPNCNICDVCVSKHKNDHYSKEDISSAISSALLQEELTIKQLTEKLKQFDATELADVARKMLDKRILKMDKDFRLSLGK